MLFDIKWHLCHQGHLLNNTHGKNKNCLYILLHPIYHKDKTGVVYSKRCSIDLSLCMLLHPRTHKDKTGFRATSLSTYDFSTLYTTLPHNLIKEKLINLIEWTFKREGSPYIACNERQAFFTSGDTKRYKLWSCQNVCEALIYLLDKIYIRSGTKLYRQIVGIPMGTNCAPLVADFLFCYERDFMTSLSEV